MVGVRARNFLVSIVTNENIILRPEFFGVQLEVGRITTVCSKEDFMELRLSFIQSNAINQLSPI